MEEEDEEGNTVEKPPTPGAGGPFYFDFNVTDDGHATEVD